MIRSIRPMQLVGAVPALFIAAGDAPLAVLALGALGLLTAIAVIRVVGWRRHTYEFSGGRIVERSGIISRNERALEIDRIQQIDVERTLLDRLVGTCELRLETAADSGDSELSLTVVSIEEAERLRTLLQRRSSMSRVAAAAPATGLAPPPPPDAETASDGGEVLVEVPLAHVALGAVTGPRLLAVPAAIAVIFGAVTDNAVPEEVLDTAESTVTGLGIVGAILLFLGLAVASIIIAAVTGIVRDGGFSIVQRGSDLLVRRGLTTTRSATVPMRRVQRVTVRRRWLQQALGFASLTVHSAGGGREGGNALDRSLTVPLLPSGDVEALVHRLLDVDTVPDLHRHPPSARRRAAVRGALSMLVALVPLASIAVINGTAAPLWAVPPVVLVGIGGGLLSYRRLASGADGRTVAGRTGLFGTTTEISPLRKTQGTTVSSSWFQRRLGLATLGVHVAGPAGGIELRDLDLAAATRLAPQLHG